MMMRGYVSSKDKEMRLKGVFNEIDTFLDQGKTLGLNFIYLDDYIDHLCVKNDKKRMLKLKTIFEEQMESNSKVLNEVERCTKINKRALIGIAIILAIVIVLTVLTGGGFLPVSLISLFMALDITVGSIFTGLGLRCITNYRERSRLTEENATYRQKLDYLNSKKAAFNDNLHSTPCSDSTNKPMKRRRDILTSLDLKESPGEEPKVVLVVLDPKETPTREQKKEVSTRKSLEDRYTPSSRAPRFYSQNHDSLTREESATTVAQPGRRLGFHPTGGNKR